MQLKEEGGGGRQSGGREIRRAKNISKNCCESIQ